VALHGDRRRRRNVDGPREGHRRAAELRGADRFTLRDGKASGGYSYFDPRPFLQGQEASTDQ